MHIRLLSANNVSEKQIQMRIPPQLRFRVIAFAPFREAEQRARLLIAIDLIDIVGAIVIGKHFGQRGLLRYRPRIHLPLGLGVLKRIVKLLQRHISDPQDTKKVVLLHVDQSEIARQDFDIAEPEAVIAALGREHEIVRKRRNLTQDLVAFVAEQIGLLETRQRRRQKIPAAWFPTQNRTAETTARQQQRRNTKSTLAAWARHPRCRATASPYSPTASGNRRRPDLAGCKLRCRPGWSSQRTCTFATRPAPDY